MKLLKKTIIPNQTCYDLSVSKNHNFFANNICVHNTNAGVGFDLDTKERWVQSKENIITPEKDNAGFAAFVHQHPEAFDIIRDRISKLRIDGYFGAVIYGEWCGGNIQAGVAINGLPKMFVAIGIKLITLDETKPNIWLSDAATAAVTIDLHQYNIYNTFDFKSYSIDIDFTHPELSTNKLVEITDIVENECPVGKAFGKIGIGEGVVWKCVTEGYTQLGLTFKVKGQKHSSSKVKKTATVDIEKVNSVIECVDQICSENRLKQGLEHLKLNQLEAIPESTGDFVRWVVGDCIKEELDTITGSGLSVKDVSGAIAKKAKTWFFLNI